MRKKLGSLVIVAALGGLGYYLYTTYDTLEPCGMLQSEVQNRLMDGDFASLGDIPQMMVNNGDQFWCAKEFVRIQLP